MDHEDRWCWPRSAVQMNDLPQIVVVSAEGAEETEAEEVVPFCRICLSDEGDIVESRCACQGTQRWVHEACLTRWRLSGSYHRRVQCEICRTLYADYLPIIDGDFAEETMTTHSPRQYVYFVTFGLFIVDCANLFFGMMINGTEPGHTLQLDTVMGISSAAKAVVTMYTISMHSSMCVTLFFTMVIYTCAVSWEYSEFIHAALNLSYSIILMGILSQQNTLRS